MYFLEETILTPGEKIRRIRHYLGLKQVDITGDKITRNLVSYIENGKTRLVRDTAEIIVESINRHSEKINMPISISVDYIMRDEETQAQMILDRYVESMTKYLDNDVHFFMEFNKAKEMFEDWDFPGKKAHVYKVSGMFYFRRNQFDEAHINYMKALENFIRVSDHANIADMYSRIALMHLRCKNYSESINLNDYAYLILKTNGLNPDSLKERILFNSGLAHKKLEEYDACLENLTELESLMNIHTSKKRYMDILSLKANCYFSKGDYKTSEKINKDILEVASRDNDIKLLAMTYLNLGNVYLKSGERELAIEHLNKCANLRLSSTYPNSETTYMELGTAHMELRDYESAEEFLLKSLDNCKVKNNTLIQIDVYGHLIEVYKETKNSSGMLNILKEIRLEFDDVNEYPKIKNAFINASLYFIDFDTDESKKLLSFIASK